MSFWPILQQVPPTFPRSATSVSTTYFPPVCYFGQYCTAYFPPVCFFGEYHLLSPGLLLRWVLHCLLPTGLLLRWVPLTSPWSATSVSTALPTSHRFASSVSTTYFPPVCYFGEYHLLSPGLLLRSVLHCLLPTGLLLRWVPPTFPRSATSVSTALPTSHWSASSVSTTYFPPQSATSVSTALPTSHRSASSVSTTYFPPVCYFGEYCTAYFPRVCYFGEYCTAYLPPVSTSPVLILRWVQPLNYGSSGHRSGSNFLFYMWFSEMLAKHCWHPSMGNPGSSTGVV